MTDSSRWDQFIHYAGRMLSHPDWDETERNYKIEIAQHIVRARDAFLSGSDEWESHLQRAFRSRYNVADWRVSGAFRKWYSADPQRGRQALQHLWHEGSEDVEQRIRSFLSLIPSDALSGHSARLSISSLLLGGISIYDYPWYRTTPFENAYKLVNYPRPSGNA